MKTEGNLAISVVGLDELEQKVLRVAVGLLSDDGVNYQLLTKNDSGGQLVVIDVDSESGREHLFQANDKQLKLLFGSRKFTAKNYISVAKPIRVLPLKEALEKVYQRLRPGDQLPTVDEPPHAHLVARQTQSPIRNQNQGLDQNPSTTHTFTLFDALFQAKQHKQVLKLKYHDGSALFVNGVNDTVATIETDHIGLNKLLQRNTDKFNVIEISVVEFEKIVDGCILSALDACLWKAGVNGSKNEILDGHSMDDAVKLKAWPSFTRHDFKPAYFKIAAVLARHAISLNKLKEALQVPQTEIISFYNAAYAVGLIDIANPAARHDLPESNTNAKRSFKPLPATKSIISKLARRLGFNV